MVFVNRFSPFLFKIPNTEIGIRWYGLAYVVGFILTYLTVRKAIADGRIPGMKPNQLEILMYLVMGGVIIGGRLG